MKKLLVALIAVAVLATVADTGFAASRLDRARALAQKRMQLVPKLSSPTTAPAPQPPGDPTSYMQSAPDFSGVAPSADTAPTEAPAEAPVSQ